MLRRASLVGASIIGVSAYRFAQEKKWKAYCASSTSSSGEDNPWPFDTKVPPI
jgi:hypothetical protein